ncbi:hypothetical protein NIES4101_68430 [Calothrix sp. NIES-4101]|nr:hypothetical protein NIES4101_68430 [Calothrix sp. NIES-4101]
MKDWIQIKGIVKKGYGVASGKSGNPRFPQGTIEMQKPFFREQGLDLDAYFSGTLNVSIYPYKYEIKQPKYTFRNVKWSPHEPAEDFSFFNCQILLNTGKLLSGLIYYPHPETKPEHFQSPDILEIMTPFISGLQYGDECILEVKSQQINII